MTNRAVGVRVAHPLFQTEGSGASPTTALQLRFDEAHLKTAKALNLLWHSRLPKFARPTCRVAYTAEFDGLYYATAIWTNPLARALPQLDWLELNRMAIAPDAPKNTASRMLAWMARDVRKRFPGVCRLISYQACDYHTGVIYRASGWVPTQRLDGGEWNNASRSRSKVVCDGPKQRWEKVLYERNDDRGTAPATGSVEPTGAESDVPLSEREDAVLEERDPPPCSTLWDTSVDC